jgi:hypothetical protein
MTLRSYAVFFLILMTVMVLGRLAMRMPVAAYAAGESTTSAENSAPQSGPAASRPDPCNRMSAYHELDFWVGKWEVFDKSSGARVGTNNIEKSLNNCAVIEHWEGVYGDIGSSVNTVNPSKRRWQQDWVSGTGVVSHFEGELTSGAMRYSGTRNMYGTGATPIRLTLAPLSDGSVRQTGEMQTDDGKWAVSYDFIYRVVK